MVLDLDAVASQVLFGELVGVSQQAVSALQSEGKLPVGATLRELLLAYCHRLREQAAGRMGDEVGGLDLAQERAALAREQRKSVELKNALMRGEYASITLLSEVLASASQAVAERFEHLPGQLRMACPDLPVAAIETLTACIADARNEWVRQTIALIAPAIAGIDDEVASDEPRAG